MASCYPGFAGRCPHCDDDHEDGPNCFACFDVGWLVGENDLIIPCTECCEEPEIHDFEEAA